MEFDWILLVNGIVSGLLLGGLYAAAASGLGIVVGAAGFWLVPRAVLGWDILLGFAVGASLLIALTLIAERAASPADATRISGMAQGVGYLENN